MWSSYSWVTRSLEKTKLIAKADKKYEEKMRLRWLKKWRSKQAELLLK